MHQSGEAGLSASHQHLRDADRALLFNYFTPLRWAWQEELGLAWEHREQSASWALGTEIQQKPRNTEVVLQGKQPGSQTH